MKNDWSPHWKSSKKPSKQRKYRQNAPLHIRHKLISAHLSKDLRQKHKQRSFPLRKGDKVKIMRGQFKGTIGEVEKVDLNHMKITVKGAEFKAKAGAAPRKYPLNASKLMIVSLNLEDKLRAKAIDRKSLESPAKVVVKK